ncbi:hypothetical protein QBC40DRAFT_275272 [Triangularia verruculosa]|uniref:Uncharacterized protein n=1 Tax=Triangularia verruculosa TaxID=2587418 RepID=A0AAN6XSL5_9PEZI|nr:hypothetical protein QBC40DRAFT_275272 [Triangularia verruculosa]
MSSPPPAPLTQPQIQQPPPMLSLSAPARRLIWTLQGPPSTAITVMPPDLNPSSPNREPFYRPPPAPNQPASFHQIFGEPISDPPAASITVQEEYLGDWRNEWYTLNQEGFDGSEPNEEEYSDMPPEFAPLVVTASPAGPGNGEFVTVGDYIRAVHPWLMGLRRQIVKARDVAGLTGGDEDGQGVRLMVTADRPELVRVEEEGEWMGTLRWCWEEGERRRREREEEESGQGQEGGQQE